MGRRGYVQTRPPEYGSCITDWAQTPLYNYLVSAGVDITTDNEWAPEDADHWEIAIPEKEVKSGKKSKWVVQYDVILAIAEKLKKHPRLVRDTCENSPYGDRAARLLEEGVAAAKPLQHLRDVYLRKVPSVGLPLAFAEAKPSRKFGGRFHFRLGGLCDLPVLHSCRIEFHKAYYTIFS